MKRGYYGIGVYHPKTETNIGTLWRSAKNFDADFIFTIGRRYKKQGSDTLKTYKHIPLFNYKTFEEFKEHLPFGCQMVFVEQTDGAIELSKHNHKESCVYILGAEDHGIPEEIMSGYEKIEINSPMCLNVAVAGSIVMYDRLNKPESL